MKKKIANRNDGAWENAYMGMGTGRDRTRSTKTMFTPPLDRQTLTQIYVSNGLAAKIVNARVDDAFSAGYKVTSNAEDLGEVMNTIDTLEIDEVVKSAIRADRIYGGSAIAIVADDSQEPNDPIDIDNISKINALTVYDRHEISIMQRYDGGEKLGMPEIYKISPKSPNQKEFTIHESRLIVFDGVYAPTDWKNLNGGWGASVIQSCYDDLVRYGTANWYSLEILSRAQQPVHKIPNLTTAAREPESIEGVRRRINVLDMARSISNTVVIDDLEDFDIKSASNVGAEQIINSIGRALCASSDYPETILFGTSPKGLSATGESDLQNYYKTVKALQNTKARPALSKLIEIVLKMSGIDSEFRIEFNALYSPTAKEIAQTLAENSKADCAYVDAQVVSVSELRNTLRREGRYILSDSDVTENPLGS